MDLQAQFFQNAINNYQETAKNDNSGGGNNKYIQFPKVGSVVLRLYPYQNQFEPFAMGTMRAWHSTDKTYSAQRYYCPVHNNPLYTLEHYPAENHPALQAENEKIMAKRKCPFCETVKELYKPGMENMSEADKDLARTLSAKKRYYYLCIQRGKEAEGVKILSCGIKTKKQIDRWFFNPEYCKPDFSEHIFHPQAGYDLTIDKSLNGDQPEYTVSPSKNASPMGTPEQMAVWEQQIKADEDFNLLAQVGKGIKSYDELLNILKNPQAAQSAAPQGISMDSLRATFGSMGGAPSTPVATPPVATPPVASTPVASTPVAPTTPVATPPVASTPVAPTTPVASTPVAPTTPVASTPVASTPVAPTTPTSVETSEPTPDQGNDIQAQFNALLNAQEG